MAKRTQFALSTLNLYNLNLPGLRMYGDAQGWDQPAYDRKLEWLRRTILQHPSDVWGFQELWHHDAIKAVFDHPDLADYALLVPPGHSGKKIVCAGAVKKDILMGEPEWINRFPEQFRLESQGGDDQTPTVAVRLNGFSRPVLHFKVRPRASGPAISVYVAHFKSKAPTQIHTEGWYRDNKTYYSRHSDALGSALSTIRRTAEATALRMMLTEVLKGTDDAVVVLGDLNDGHTSNTLNILTGQPNYILSGLDQGGSDTALYAASRLQQYRSDRDVYYTHIHQNLRESLDHILVSQEFYDNSRKRQWAFNGMDIVNDHLNHDEHNEDGSSDHGMVRARFEYRPAKA
jgi:Endonuclease/Exonuclease/phosphatase family